MNIEEGSRESFGDNEVSEWGKGRDRRPMV
jgi:hypothetical protein